MPARKRGGGRWTLPASKKKKRGVTFLKPRGELSPRRRAFEENLMGAS